MTPWEKAIFWIVLFAIGVTFRKIELQLNDLNKHIVFFDNTHDVEITEKSVEVSRPCLGSSDQTP